MFAFFFFNDTATTEIYTLSLHDALPIWNVPAWMGLVDYLEQNFGTWTMPGGLGALADLLTKRLGERRDRKSTRLNSSHANISYAVFCLKKTKKSRALSVHTSCRTPV